MWVTLVASAVVHALMLMPIAAALLDDEAYEPAEADEPMRIRVIDASSDDRLANLEEAVDDAREVEPEPEPEPEKQDETKPYLPSNEPVVDLTPEDADFTGRQNTQADKDQIKRGTEGAPIAALEKRDRPSMPSPAAAASRARRDDPVEDTEATEEPTDEPPEPTSTDREERFEDSPRESDIILPTARDEREGEEQDAKPNEGAPRDGEGELVDAKGLFPSAEDAAAVASKLGDGGTFDYLKDVDEGDRTLLNRQQNRYWVFYDRMRRAVERNWKVRKEWRKRDPYGNVYGVGSFYTVVAMTLNSDGSIRRMRVVRSSGKEFMDDSATNALAAVGKFPNPPEGMKDEDGLIHINFGFMFEVVSGGGLRLFRAKPERPF
jgi:TonB family protein